MTPTDKIPTPRQFEQQLVHFINTTLLGGTGTVERDTRLFEDGYMNSLRILDLIAMVEKSLGTRIPDRMVRLANFRSIATISQAFHPNAALEPTDSSHAERTVGSVSTPSHPNRSEGSGSTSSHPERSEGSASPDRIFNHHANRSRIEPSVNSLLARGDLTISSAGQVSLSGLALDVLNAVDHTVLDWARSLGAPEYRYPSIIALDVLNRAGQVASFPQHLTTVSAAESPTPHGSRYALSPAVCYHAYPDWEGKTLGDSPAIITACGRCYRYEGGDHVPLERLWDFTMREIIVLGTRDQVEGTRQALVRHVAELVTSLGLDATIDLASDPFFTAGDEGKRLMQQAGALKYELQLTIDATGRTIAAASFNHHHEFFGERFNIRLANGAFAHSGCVAFGLERWVLALTSQFGVDEPSWPTHARDWLSKHRSGMTGAGA